MGISDLILVWIIYIVGFFITLIVLTFFGKKMGFDYDPPHPPYYDDYDTSGHAYLSFSFMWFIFVPTMLLVKVCGLFVDLINKIKR